MVFIRDVCGGGTVSPSHGRARTAAALFLVVASLLANITASAGDLDKVVDFNIDAQTLDKALLEFGAQAHVQIMFEWDSATARLRTHELKGSYTAKEALAKLLQGTRLRYVAQGHTLEILPLAVVDPIPPARAFKSLGVQRQGDLSNPNPLRSKIIDRTVINRHSPTSQSPQTLGEIVVTAQKYRQLAFDVPISLDVLTGQKLLEHGITNLSDLQYDVPGLYMDSTGVGRAVYLRGVANNAGTGAMVGEYIDDADITSAGFNAAQGVATNDDALYDLNRVEVLKGPQGTLYGDGSMGGVIRYITNRPVLDRVEMNADMAMMFTQYGAPSQRIETMLNTPLVDGALGLRLAGMFEHDGGWVDEPAANLKNINGSNLVDVRAEALWEPTDNFNVNAMQIVHRDAYGQGRGEDTSGNIVPLFGTTFVPNGTNSSNTSNITIKYDLAGARLLSSSSYVDGDESQHDLYESYSYGPKTYWVLEPGLRAHNEDFSEEVRLVHWGEGPWQWTAGGFYKNFHGLYANDEYFGSSGSSLSSAYYFPSSSLRSSSSSWAGYVDTSYKFFGRLIVGAGTRYFKDRETETQGTATPTEAATFTSTDPRFYLQYQLAPHINSYASASKGFRSGGFNANGEPPFQPEVLWNYDLGTKISLPEDGIRVDVDLFYDSYTNFVTEAFIPPFTLSANAGKARIRGADADVTWQPVAQWRLNFNTEILNTKFLTTTAISGFAPGERLPFAPEYSFTASVQRNYRWSGKPVYAELYYSEISRVQFREVGFPLGQSDILQFLNARIGVHWSDWVTVGLFAHNLLNDRGNESPWGTVFDLSVRPRPRTFGIEFSAR